MVVAHVGLPVAVVVVQSGDASAEVSFQWGGKHVFGERFRQIYAFIIELEGLLLA